MRLAFKGPRSSIEMLARMEIETEVLWREQSVGRKKLVRWLFE
jgi:hypothetical protein